MDEKRKWVASEITEDVHRTLYSYATEIGEHPKSIIERFIIEGLENAAKEAKTPSLEMRTFLEAQKVVQKEQVFGQLGRIAWSATRFGDEETFDTLRQLCDEHGITVQEVMESVKLNVDPPIVSKDNGTGITSAMNWLQAQFNKTPQVPSLQIISIGEAMGFSKPTLNAAKRRLGIISVRLSSCWAWSIPGYDPPVEILPDTTPKPEEVKGPF